ncbi:MAG: hypothetical protein ACI9QV_001316 [Methylophagaceae bacterium]|jgi:hypothetical protein
MQGLIQYSLKVETETLTGMIELKPEVKLNKSAHGELCSL